MGERKHDLESGKDGEQPLGYEPPALKIVGSVYMLTLGSPGWCVPVIKKTIGPPDFVNFIPVTSCS
jgi:hypothetical protein